MILPLRKTFLTISIHVRTVAPLVFSLPVLITALLKKADLVCSANLFSTGKSDVASFYNIWEAVTAVFSVCVRHGKTGSVRGLGMFQE